MLGFIIGGATGLLVGFGLGKASAFNGQWTVLTWNRNAMAYRPMLITEKDQIVQGGRYLLAQDVDVDTLKRVVGTNSE
jgi:hypothetical protein